MRTAGLVCAVLVILAGAAFFLGYRFDDAADAEARAETFERILDADVGEGDGVVDGIWVGDWLHRNAD